MRITRSMVVGIAAIMLGIMAFAYQGFSTQTTAGGQNIWRVPPLVGTWMLLATGIVLVAAEARAIWLKVRSGKK